MPENRGQRPVLKRQPADVRLVGPPSQATSVASVVPRSKSFGHLEAEDETANALRVAVAEFKSRHVHPLNSNR